MEYEDVLSARWERRSHFPGRRSTTFLTTYARSGKDSVIHYLWRPALRDPHDDMILELAVSAECNYIISL